MNKGFKVIGIDNDSRKKFFGHDASVSKNINQLLEFKSYEHLSLNILNKKKIEDLLSKYRSKIRCIVHCAAQPSHDWATTNIIEDFRVNTISTVQLLNAYKNYCRSMFYKFIY